MSRRQTRVRQQDAADNLPARSNRRRDGSSQAWTCDIDFLDAVLDEPCPRCGRKCLWWCRMTVYSSGPFSRGTIWSPICACPDDHIRRELRRLLAQILVADLRKHPPELPRQGSRRGGRSGGTDQ